MIFAIVIIGVLAAVAVPQFGKLKKSAEISKAGEVITVLNRNANALFYNEVKLMGQDPDSLNILTFVSVDGNGWDDSNGNTAGGGYVTYDGEGFSARFEYDDVNTTAATIVLTLSGENKDASMEAINSRHGLDINDTANTHTWNLDSTGNVF